MRNMARVLVPIDFSNSSSRALQLARANMRSEPSSVLFLLYVQERLPDVGYLLKNGPRPTDRRRSAAEAKMSEWIEEVPGPVRAVPLFGYGDVAGEIVRHGRAEQVDLVVLTRHARAGFSHFFRSSVTERVSRALECPVWILRFERGIPHVCALGKDSDKKMDNVAASV